MNLGSYLRQHGLEFGSDTISKLERYTEILLEWNKIHNLSGAKDTKRVYENIVDSLYPLLFIDMPKRLLDVGTGAGFPGLILAIAMPQTDVTLAEPLKKRVAFLRFVVASIELENVSIEPRKVQELKCDSFDMITSRAVSDTKLLLELTNGLKGEQTQYLLYKGSKLYDELETLTQQIDYDIICLLYTSPSPRDRTRSRMPSSA